MLKREERFELELKLLKALLNSEEIFICVYNENYNPGDLFVDPLNRKIYEVSLEVYIENKIPDERNVLEYLIFQNADEDLKKHLRETVQSTYLDLNITLDFKHAIKLVEDVIEIKAKEIVGKLEKEKISGLEYAEKLTAQVDQLILDKFEGVRRHKKSNQEQIANLLTTVKRVQSGEICGDYLPTGFKSLDRNIIGFPRGHLSAIAGRPGSGKTSFMLALKRNLVKQGRRVFIISIEMTSDQLWTKDISALTKIDSLRIEAKDENHPLTASELEQIQKAGESLANETVVIDDDENWNIEKIKACIRRNIIRERIDICFLDYLTKIKTNRLNDRYDLQIGALTDQLRQFAKLSNLPIVVLSQLNRQSESRSDKKPALSDLRESGAIEQDCKLVMLLHRPTNYGIVPENLNWKKADSSIVKSEEYFEIIIGKCRNGRIGTVPMAYNLPFHSFENLSRKDERSPEPVQHSTQRANWYERETGEESPI